MKRLLLPVLLAFLGAVVSASAFAQTCENCHNKITPSIVQDWQLSKHSQGGMGCSICHGDEHQTAEDAGKARIPTPDTCASCHAEKVNQFKGGKHGLAWSSMKAMPTVHWQPMVLIQGMKGCGSCH